MAFNASQSTPPTLRPCRATSPPLKEVSTSARCLRICSLAGARLAAAHVQAMDPSSSAMDAEVTGCASMRARRSLALFRMARCLSNLDRWANVVVQAASSCDVLSICGAERTVSRVAARAALFSRVPW